MKALTFVLTLIAVSLFAAEPAESSMLLYDNGPATGLSDEAIYASQGETTNSFTLAQPAILTEIRVALQLVDRPSQPSSLDWAIGTLPFGNDYGSGTVSLTNTFLFHNASIPTAGIWESTFELTDLPLLSGTYFLTLRNSVSTSGDGIFWDRAPNGAPSTAYFDQSANPPILAPSSSFQVYGTPVPEPGSIALLGIGLIGCAGAAWRKRKLK